MRELKDYFCNFVQTQELLKLGIKFDSLAYYFNHEGKNYFASSMDYFENNDLIAPLRSQALDYFRDLGYTFNSCIAANDNKFACDCLNRFGDYISDSFESPHEAESALIDKLIELEKEARNGK